MLEKEEKPTMTMIVKKTKKQKLRNAEYYDMQDILDRLYEQSLNNKVFKKLMEIIVDEQNIKMAYRNLKKNSGSKTAGVEGMNGEPGSTMLHFYLNDRPGNLYVDYIDNAVPVVSQKLKNMLCKFQPSVSFIPAVFVDARTMHQDTYWGMVPESIVCLSDKSEFNKNGTVKNIVIDIGKMIDQPRVFKVAGIMEDYILVDLCVAEAILRRGFTGVELQKVDMD